ncbi:MAG: thioredoxin, partial [Gammaproteobacteria bacterium]|nr:thioredoxin [Gammaproteobacteria bacterium]
MNTIPTIVDATLDHFNDLLEISREVPVVVDFWAEWCGPCKSLMPILTKLAEEYQGKFILAKANIDAQQELAMEFGVRSVPTVILFRHGKPVDQFMGAQPEAEVRRFIDAHLSRPADARIQAARESLERHDVESALEQARTAVAEDEAYTPAQLVLIEALLTAGKVEDAGARLDQLPVDMLADPAVGRLRALRLFAEAAADAPEQAALERAVA